MKLKRNGLVYKELEVFTSPNLIMTWCDFWIDALMSLFIASCMVAFYVIIGMCVLSVVMILIAVASHTMSAISDNVLFFGVMTLVVIGGLAAWYLIICFCKGVSLVFKKMFPEGSSKFCQPMQWED